MNVHAQQQLNKAKSGTVSDVMQFVQWELLGEFQSRKQAVNQWDVGNNGTTVLHYLTSWNPPLPLRICVWLDNRLLFQLPAPIVKSITGWWGGVRACVSECVCVCACIKPCLVHLHAQHAHSQTEPASETSLRHKTAFIIYTSSTGGWCITLHMCDGHLLVKSVNSYTQINQWIKPQNETVSG